MNAAVTDPYVTKSYLIASIDPKEYDEVDLCLSEPYAAEFPGHVFPQVGLTYLIVEQSGYLVESTWCAHYDMVYG